MSRTGKSTKVDANFHTLIIDEDYFGPWGSKSLLIKCLCHTLSLYGSREKHTQLLYETGPESAHNPKFMSFFQRVEDNDGSLGPKPHPQHLFCNGT